MSLATETKEFEQIDSPMISDANPSTDTFKLQKMHLRGNNMKKECL